LSILDDSTHHGQQQGGKCPSRGIRKAISCRIYFVCG